MMVCSLSAWRLHQCLAGRLIRLFHLVLLASVCAECCGAQSAASRAFRLRHEHDDERGSVVSRRSHRSARSHRSGRSRRASSSDDDLEVGKLSFMGWPITASSTPPA